MTMTFADDLQAAARIGWGPNDIDDMARIGFTPGDLARFLNLDPGRRDLILRMLDHPTDADHEAMRALPDSKELASWLLTLPAYRNVPEDDDEPWPT